MSFLIFILIIIGVIALMVVMSALSFVFNILKFIFSFGRIRPRTATQQASTNYSEPSYNSTKERISFNKQDAEDAEYEEVR